MRPIYEGLNMTSSKIGGGQKIVFSPIISPSYSPFRASDYTVESQLNHHSGDMIVCVAVVGHQVLRRRLHFTFLDLNYSVSCDCFESSILKT